MSQGTTQDDQPDEMVASVRVDWKKLLDALDEAIVKLPADYEQRVISMCEPLGLGRFGNVLADMLRQAKETNDAHGQRVQALDLFLAIRHTTRNMVHGRYPAEELLTIIRLCPRLWKCLVEDTVIRAPAPTALSDEQTWQIYMLDQALDL